MKRLQKASVLLSLGDALRDRGSWCGETHCQKTTYFLQELMRVPLDFAFILYKHGPFSFDLRSALSHLMADRILRYEIRQYPYGPSLADGENAELVRTRFPNTPKQYQPEIDFIAEKLGHKRVVELERLGTAFYVIREREDREPHGRARRIVELKPHIEFSQAREAISEVDTMVADAQELLAGKQAGRSGPHGPQPPHAAPSSCRPLQPAVAAEHCSAEAPESDDGPKN